MAGDVLQIPLALLREVARELDAAADDVGGARRRPAVAYDAGRAQAAVGEAVAGVDAALAGLAGGLADASRAFAETAADLDDADRRARVRLYERTFGIAPDPGP